MSDTCIVCLGDLSTSGDSTYRLVSPSPDGNDNESSEIVRRSEKASSSGLIAHLLPCGHDLHDECLRPWVERANSCPICRQSFNSVDLVSVVGGMCPLSSTATSSNEPCVGPVESSYTVEDRVQVADIDPSMIIDDEDDEEDESETCMLCGHGDGDDLLFIFCDGCDLTWHFNCTGLESIPRGDWYCNDCAPQRFSEEIDYTPHTPSRPHSRSTNTTTGRRTSTRRRRNTRPHADREWSRVWRYVATELDFDLEFPFEDDGSLVDSRALRDLQTHEHWRRRLLIAERNGAANRFRARAPIPSVREKPDVQEPESQEELRAWNAMEKAKELEENPLGGRNKRKRDRSSTASPVEAQPTEEPERKLKRPRTRRTVDPAESGIDGAPGPSRGRQSSLGRPLDSTIPRSSSRNRIGGEPSFLQSLLKEVESVKPQDSATLRPHPLMTDHPSPLTYTSPASSPTTSNHPSPKAAATTPPAHLSNRPGSPTFLSSKVEPIFSSPEFSPSRSPRSISPTAKIRQKLPDFSLNETRPSRPQQSSTARSSRPRAQDLSPTRATMPLEVKSEISKMVGEALKPYYHNDQISKEAYTAINRDVSRMLYDKIGDMGVADQSAREEWEKIATDETSKAVESLKSYGGFSDR
jgi:hypothetical protein